MNSEGHPDRVRLTPVPGFRKQAVRRWAHRPLRPGTVVRSDGLGCFRGVQDAGCAHRPTVTGGGQGSCETPGLQGVSTLLGNVQRSLDATFHACAAQYAGRDLGACAYRSNRRFQLQDCVPRLTSIAARTSPLTTHFLKLVGTSG